MEKENDFLVAKLENPQSGVLDFMDTGLNTENTGMLTKDEYKKSPYIQQKFTQDGKFNESSFDKYYANANKEYQILAQNTYEDLLVKGVEFNSGDIYKPRGAKLKEVGYEITKITSPNKEMKGFGQLGKTEDPNWTASEIAQNEKIHDSKTGEEYEYSPNEAALTSSIPKFFSEIFNPKVIATWDNDGIHTDETTGEEVSHKKGQYKYNKNGTYYYETLDGRNPANKTILSSWDTLTVDGVGANRYDWMDSDGLDKSAAGTVAKMVTKIAPLALSIGFPTIGTIYAWSGIGLEMMQAMPMLYEMTAGLMSDSDTPAVLNNISGFARGLMTGTSDYAKKHMFSLENFASIISDVPNQWAQQQAIAKGVNKMLGTNLIQDAIIKKTYKSPKELMKLYDKMGSNNELAKYGSLAYMSMISNIDVYDSMLRSGATRHEAAMAALGGTVGMTYANQKLGFGEMFLDNDTKKFMNSIATAVGKSAKQVQQEVARQSVSNAERESVNHLMGVFNLAKTKSADAIKGLFKDIKNGTATVYQKAIGEGIEEVSEELIMDFSKATTETLANFGWRGPLDQLDTDAFDHMLERYTMSLIGGAIGGGIFGGIESFKVRGVKNNELNRELTYYVSKGYTGKILDELEKLRDKGLLASKDLSAKREIDKETGEVVYQSTTNKEESQNEAVYQILRSSVLAYDAAINQNGLDVSDNELINILSNNDVRLKSLLDNHYDGKMINDFHNLTNEILDLEEKIKQITTSRKVLTDKEERNLTTEERGLIEKFNTEKDELLKKYDEKKIEAENFKNGNKSLYYIKQFLFGVNDYVNNPFLNSNFESWVFGTTGKEVASLSKSELDNLHERYKQYVAGTKVDNIQSALDVFDRFNMEYSNSLQENEDTYKNVSNLRFDLFDEIYQHSDDGNALINDVGGFVVKDGFAFVNEDYITQLRDEIEELVKEGKADEIAEKQKEIDESVKQNQNVILNVNKLIDTITANYGYIDADSIKMIRNLFLSKTDIMKSLLAHNKMANGLKVSDIDKLINEKIMSGKKEDIDEIKGSIVENAVKEYNENKINAITEITDKYEREAKEDVKSIAGDLVNAVAEKTGFEDSSEDETLFKIETKKIPDGTEIKIRNRTITNIKISYEVIDANSESQETIFSSAGEFSLRSEEDDDGNNKIVSDNEELENWIKEKRKDGTEDDDFSFIINQKISFDVKFNEDSNVGYSSKITNWKTVEMMSLTDSVVKTEEVTLNSEEKIEKASKELFNDVTTVVDDVVNDYTVKSSQLSAINSLDQRLSSAKVNPIYDLIRKFAINNTGEKVNIIDFIEEQDKKLENVKGIEDYVLSDDAMNDIKRARDILKIINSIIIASRNIEANQFAFNTILNKYIKDHSLEGQNENTYGVIDPILANQMCTEVTRLEIRLKALEMLSVNNQMNKFKQFMKTGEKIDKSKLDFYKQPMMLELTEGIDFSKYETAWDENHELYINEIESLIYDNFKKRVDSGTKNQVDEFNKLQAVNELRDEVKKKGYKTAMLDKEVELTDLNKLTLLGALVAVRSNDYNLAIKKSLNEFPDNFAPIPSQDFATRILSSYIINRDLMTSIIEDNPYSNIVIGEGVAGSGKTTAEGKLSLYIARELLGNDTKAWTASFSQDQVNNITSSIQGDNPESIHTKIDSSKRIYEANGLLDHILGGKVAELLSEVGKAESFFNEIIKGNPKVTKESIKEEYDKFSILNISESGIEIKDKIKEEIMSGDNDAPSVLYIDEYTWLMPPALNIIQLWAKRNGVTVICLGDSNQNGYDLRYADGNKTLSSDLTNGNNMIKTPKLGMSLRENNIQKSSNIRTSNIILDTINNVNFENESDVNELLKYVTGFPVSVYDNNGIVNGEKITSSLDDSFFDEQKKSDNAKIGYIYDSIDSDTYKQMTKKKDEGYNIVFFTEKEVQGNECPYFVVDID